MRSRLGGSALVGVIVVCLLLPPDARAQDEPASAGLEATSGLPNKRFSDQPWVLELKFGLATTVGLLGVAAEVTPTERLTFGTGVGLNLLGLTGGANARARPLIVASADQAHALFIELGFSRGRMNTTEDTLSVSAMCDGSADEPGDRCYRVEFRPERVDWAQLELGWEARFGAHLAVRTSLGVARALNEPDWRCQHAHMPASCAGQSAPFRTLFVETTSVGYAF